MKNKKIKPIVIIEKEETNLKNIFVEFDSKTQNRPYGIDVVQEINKILEEESTSTLPKGIDVEAELSTRFSEEMLKKNPIDWKGFINGDYDDSKIESINEPYTYKDTTEYKTSDKPINVIRGFWKDPKDSNEISMELQFEYTPQDDSNVREDYKELIANMWKAKHRNEIICKEIDAKYDLLMKEKE